MVKMQQHAHTLPSLQTCGCTSDLSFPNLPLRFKLSRNLFELNELGVILLYDLVALGSF